MHVLLLVGEFNGKPAFEPVHAQPLGGATYKIEFSPCFAFGIAAGDEFELSGDGNYRVLTRAGNVAVRVLSGEPVALFEKSLSTEVQLTLGGRLDGSIAHGLVYTVPVKVGFPAIERVFIDFMASTPGILWEFGNVYDDDGNPLCWWEDAT
jgi:hypothetical protein